MDTCSLTDAVNPNVAPSDEPSSLTVFSVNSSSVTLQWMPPGTPNGVITHYSILYNGTNVTNFGNTMLMGTVGGLLPDTEYDVQMRAHTSVGVGPAVSIIILTCRLLNIRVFKFIKICYVY